MGPHLGRFVRRVLVAPDPDAAAAFHADLLGWTWRPGPDGTRIATAAGRDIAELAAGPGPAAWTPVMGVPDVAAACEAAVAAGGHVEAPPRDVPGTGRVARVVDPQGIVLGVLAGEVDLDLPIRPPPSTFCWETLHAADVTDALAFVRRVLPVSLSNFDTMQTLAAADGSQVADVQAAPPGTRPGWRSHVAVADPVAVAARAADLGAEVLVSDQWIPNFGRLAWIRDPWGAELMLLAPL